MTDDAREKALLAACMAATFKPDYMTNDKLEAATRGHGSLVIPVYSAANSLAEDVFCAIGAPEMSLMSSRMTMVDAAAASLPLDMVIEKAVRQAALAGAAPENAALIVAALAYFTGSCARAGVPLGNRKLGAIARMHAGAGRTSAIALTTGKFTHKVPAFPAYLAVYQQLREKKLTRVDGSVLPPFIAGGAIYGHSALGEDINIPELAKNTAFVGTQAMIESMIGAGITPYPLWPALIGSAVALEMVHPDAALGEEFGPFGTVDSAYLAGKGAVEAAKLPDRIHVRGTHEEYDMARVIGDFGLILKDIGGPSVIASMILDEIFAGFEESPVIGAGFSGGPVNPPLGHVCGDVMPALRLLMQNGGDPHQAADAIEEYKLNSFIDPEMALCSLSTIARKAEVVSRGLVTHACVLAGESVRDRAVYRRAARAWEMLEAGSSLEEVCRSLDDERRAKVEERGSAILSGFTGHEVRFRFTEIAPQGRRTDRFTKKYWGFDARVSYDVSIDGKDYHIDNLSAKAVPAFAVEGTGRDDPSMGTALFAGAVLTQELMYIGHTIINVTVPAAVAAVRGADGAAAAKEAERGAYLTRAIPGGADRAAEVSSVATRIHTRLIEPAGA
jgi:methylthioribose-1-phosphate isomerase